MCITSPMKITHYLYNAFLIETGDIKIAIDPGQHLGLFELASLIPESEWPDITHIVITHGDPDHHWQSDRVAAASNAHIVCGTELCRSKNGQTLLVGPRGRGLTAWVPFENVHALNVGESVTLDGVTFEGVRAVHGPIEIPLLGFKLRTQPGPDERVGLGAMGFKLTIGDKSVVNLGDTLLQRDWAGLRPDVLMLPIGGRGNNTWTMDVRDALQAVELIAPRHVIPCHYNVPFFWIRNIASADDKEFKQKAEQLGVECHILGRADSIDF